MNTGKWRVFSRTAALLCAFCLALCGTARAQAFTVTEPELIAEEEGAGISVRVERYRVNTTKCYVARVRIDDASQLRTEPAYAFDRDQTAEVSSIARRTGAILAINGDYFSYQNGGYMIRGGVLYRSSPIEGRDVLLIDGNGDFTIVQSATAESLAAYADSGIVDSFNFGPGLVVNGQVLEEYDAKYNAGAKQRQRSCIAQVERGKLEYLCICCEGPVESENGGLTMTQFAQFVLGLGVENAYNLDGGDSTALVYRGEKLNAPDNRNHRPISDIIYFAGADAGEAE